jgi:hypothetical protein
MFTEEKIREIYKPRYDIYLTRLKLFFLFMMAPAICAISQPSGLAAKGSHTILKEDQYGHYFPLSPDALKLESNFGPMVSEQIGYLQPTTVDTPIEVMQERFLRDGYLFVSEILSSSVCWAERCTGQGIASEERSSRMQRGIFPAYGSFRPPLPWNKASRRDLLRC